jgi:hypothetical protein
VDRIIRLARFAFQYVVTCGDLSFLSEEGKALASAMGDERAAESMEKDTTRVHTFVEESHEASLGSSHGAITSLFAGTAPQAGELNGKVGFLLSRLLMARLLMCKKTTVSYCLGARHTSE